MKDIPIKSKIIIGLAYDEDRRRLKIVFKNGKIRLFAGVTKDVVGDLVASVSPGEFYIDYIRDRFKRIAA